MLFFPDSDRCESFQQLCSAANETHQGLNVRLCFLKLSDQMQMDLLKIFAVLSRAEPRAVWRPGRLQNGAVIHPHTTIISPLRKGNTRKKKSEKTAKARQSDSVSLFVISQKRKKKVNICTFSNRHLFPGTNPIFPQIFKSGDHPPQTRVRLRFLPLKRTFF